MKKAYMVDPQVAEAVARHPSRPRCHLGSGDERPPVLRPGSGDALKLPSRFGSELRWPDGRRAKA